MKTKFFKLKTPPFNGTINVWYGEFKDIAEDIEKRHQGTDFLELIGRGTVATVIRLQVEEGEAVCMMLSPEIKNNAKYLIHECLHAAWFVLDNVGVDVDVDNHEVLSYLQGYLYERIVKKLKL
jgi:hypothetical protein